MPALKITQRGQSEKSRSMRSPAPALALALAGSASLFFLLLLPLLLPTASGQGCSDSCPPRTAEGLEIPSLCVGDSAPPSYAAGTYAVCHPNARDAPSSFTLEQFRSPGRVTVLSNFYVGCNAGRRESGVYAHVAQRYYDEYPDRVVFINGLKGGIACRRWAGTYQRDAEVLYPESDVRPREMPLSVNDVHSILRDNFFTPPFGHPSYVVLDENLTIRAKFVGPCCGIDSYFDCTGDIARRLDDRLSEVIDTLLAETRVGDTAPAPAPEPAPAPDEPSADECAVGEWTDWSACSVACGDTPGVQFRWRTVSDGRAPPPSDGDGDGDGESPLTPCPDPVETRPCDAPTSGPGRNIFDGCDGDRDACVPEFGAARRVEAVQGGFASPRDVAFHPTPGLHLGSYSEGREFHPGVGDEAWVVNGANHSVSIVSAMGVRRTQTTISRRDRGYYHYMINATALSFNSVSGSGRDADKDSFNYWAVCNDNNNDYLGSKEPNYFMGPTLYDSKPQGGNLVNRLGEECGPGEPCFFLHADMLHESPSCIGIAHDPETRTTFGNVYWAFDATGDRTNGQLVRYDFQQPHGPGSMDHSIAAVRRYPEVRLERGPPDVHAGIVVHPDRREVYIASPGAGTVIAVGADSGAFARTAREEYPIFSNRLPSFEYSIWECVERRVFASGLDMPSGVALSPDGRRLFVAEHATGRIHAFEVSSGSRLGTIETGFASVGGMAFAPRSGILHFVDVGTDSLAAVKPIRNCPSGRRGSRLSPGFAAEVESARAALGDEFSLHRDYGCAADPIVPDAAFFDQVHDDSGYAADDPDVQSNAGMDDSAALLADRTDCGSDDPLNFDALLLGGYYCHVCLPSDRGAMCDAGGECSNVQWRGYTCDNEFVVRTAAGGGTLSLESADGTTVSPASLSLRRGVTYRFIVEGDETVTVADAEDPGASSLDLPGNGCNCARDGPLLVPVDGATASALFLRSSGSGSGAPAIRLAVDGESTEKGNVQKKRTGRNRRRYRRRKNRRRRFCRKRRQQGLRCK